MARAGAAEIGQANGAPERDVQRRAWFSGHAHGNTMRSWAEVERRVKCTERLAEPRGPHDLVAAPSGKHVRAVVDGCSPSANAEALVKPARIAPWVKPPPVAAWWELGFQRLSVRGRD